MDSTKLLTEKLALARELSSLRPEVDHLRAQAASNEKLLAEKLSLEHQLATLQVKLETEKKSTQRILAREGKARAEDAEMESQLQVLQAEVSRERREKQKTEREAQQASSTWEAQKTNLESRLESLKTKLRATKESLKESQQELQNARATAKPAFDERAVSTIVRPTVANPRKRAAAQMLSDSMIGTPGDGANQKRTKRSSALPGDKSTFSITPFLNRTASVAPESPEEATKSALDGDNTAEAADAAQDVSVPKGKTTKASAIEKRPGSKEPGLGIAKTSKTNAKAARGQNRPKVAAKLEKVAEEEQDENDEATENYSKVGAPAAEDQSILRGGEAKKKKRRFLGGLSSTLFDEDDRETEKPGPGVRAFGSLSKGTLAGAKSRPLLAASSVSGSGFGAFSPLKRNIRHSAVGA